MVPRSAVPPRSRSDSKRTFSRQLLLLQIVGIALAALLIAPAAQAQLKWRSLETKDLRLIYYDDEHYYVVPHLARCFENSMGYLQEFFDYDPSEQVTILFQDFDDYGYAGASTIPTNYITLGIEPFEYVYEVSPTNERFNWVVSHELVHVVASEKPNGPDRFWRSLFFGKVMANSRNPESLLWSYLTSPRRYAPRWYHEGFAVFMETWMAGGIGRAQGGYDEMVFRTMVDEDAHFYSTVGLESEGTTSDFQVGQNSYLYGTRFMNYLGYTFGPEKVTQWINRGPGSKASFKAQFKKTFDESMDKEWSRWIEFEHAWQDSQLAKIRNYPVTPERTVADKPLGSASRPYYDADNDKFYMAVNYPGDFAHLASIDRSTGEHEKIAGIKGPALYYVTSLAYDDSAKVLFYTTNNGKGWRDLNRVDIATGKSEELIRDCRIGDLTFSPSDKTLWGVQHHNGKSTLCAILPPYDDWGHVLAIYSPPFGTDIYDIDISPDGQYITASMFEITGRSRLIRMNTTAMLLGEPSYEVLYEFPLASPMNFVYSPDGKAVYGSSYTTGVANIFRYNFETLEMEALSNCETGYFRPTPVPGDSLLTFRYAKDGLSPVMIKTEQIFDIDPVAYLGTAVGRKYPVVEQWKLGSPKDVDLEAATTYKGGYNRIKNLGLTSIYPITESYKGYAAVGLRMDLMDPVGLNSLMLTGSYTPTSPSDQFWHFDFEYSGWPWTLKAWYNHADFYDYFGPTKRARQGWMVGLDYENYFISDKPRSLQYYLGASYFADLTVLPGNQNVAATSPEYAPIYALLQYKRLHRSIGAVDYEKGLTWDLGFAGNWVEGEQFYTKWEGAFSLGLPTGWDHSSLWGRFYTGYSLGERDDAFANFYFGGFKNNYVDHQNVKRYRMTDTFPGFEIDELSGTDYFKVQGEWTLPPWKFKKVGFPFLYTTYMRPALFGNGLISNIGDGAFETRAASFGGQIDFKIVLSSGLPWTLSFGYAVGFENAERRGEEFMISLKIM